MADGGGGGYRAALADPLVRSIWAASAVSVVGDYVGQGALLILAFERAGGRVLGSAILFAVGAVPALLSGALGGSFLDRLPRIPTLVGLQLLGAGLIALPVLIPGFGIVLVAAGGLGAVRAATAAVRSGAMAEGIPESRRGPLLALLGTTEQASQVLGYITGGVITITIGAAPALLIDAGTFVVGALVLLKVSLPPPTPRDRRPAPTAGLRDILSDPVLRLLAPLVWITAVVGAAPEVLAPGIAPGSDWTPFLLAAAPAGQALTFTVLGRLPHIGRPSVQLTHLAWLALAFGIAALGRSAPAFVISNVLVGSGVAWVIGPQLTFMRLAPQERMAQVTGTMIALVIAAEGLGTPLLAALADRTSVATAYRVAGITVLVAAVIGWMIKERTPSARALDEEEPSATDAPTS